MDNEYKKPKKQKVSTQLTVAIIGALAICMAAIIGLGQPIVERLVANYMPEATATPVTQSVVQVEGTTVRSLLYDDFKNGTDFYNGFNPEIWQCFGCGRDGNVTNHDGVLRIDNGSTLHNQQTWATTEIDYVQWKTRIIESGQNGNDAHLGLGIDVSPDWWLAFCWIASEDDGLFYNCSVSMKDKNQKTVYEYYANEVPVSAEKWYTIKIEFDKSTMAIRFYLDDKQIGHFLPQNADELRGKQTHVELGVYGNGNMVSDFDDILVVRAD